MIRHTLKSNFILCLHVDFSEKELQDKPIWKLDAYAIKIP